MGRCGEAEKLVDEKGLKKEMGYSMIESEQYHLRFLK